MASHSYETITTRTAFSNDSYDHCTFSATGSGYGGCLYSTSGGTLTISDSQFTNCSAYAGAGLYMSGGTSNSITITDTTFTNCTASWGGALAVDTSAPTTIEITRCTFSGCSPNGSGAMNCSGTITVTDSNFLGVNDTIKAHGTLTFAGTNYLNASLISAGTYKMADNAALVFGNTSTINVQNLQFASGNSLTFGGTAAVNFTGQSLSGVGITVDTTAFQLAQGAYTIATNIAGVSVEDITVTDPDLWTLALSGGTLTANLNAINANLYGPAEKFPGATVGERTLVTAYGKNFAGIYQGDSAANGGVMMYGVTIGSGLYTNGRAYAYDCTVTGQLKVNSGGAYEVVNTLFSRTSSGNAIWIKEASNKVTTVSGSTFRSGNNILVEAGDVLEFRDTNYFNANIAIGSTGGTVQLADSAALVFGNSSNISVADLTFGTGNALTFKGTGSVAFASGEDLTGVAVTVDTTDFSLAASTYTLATNFAGVSVEDITVTDPDLWTLALSGGTLTANNAKAVFDVNMYGPAEKYPGATVGSAVNNYVLPGYDDYIFNGTYKGTSLSFAGGTKTLVVGGSYSRGYTGLGNSTSLYFSDVTLTNTTTSEAAYGGMWSLRGGNTTLVLLGVTINSSGEQKNAYSGGFVNILGGSIVIDNTTISGQKATIGGALTLGGGADSTASISNTTFSGNTATAGASRGGAFESNTVVTVTDSTFATASDTINNTGSVTFAGTNYLNASLYGTGSYTLADSAALVFGNSSNISVADLTFGTGNALTFKGTGSVAFASGEDLTGVAVTVDTTDFSLAASTYTLATNFAGVSVEDITVTDPDLWTLALSGGTLTANLNAINANLYGPAEKFPGATVGERTIVTAYGKNFAGFYQGDSAANGGVMMYGVTIGSGFYTNGRAYAYDCTVTGQLKVNSGGSYEIINTTFDRASSGNALWLNEASSTATTVSNSTFNTGSNILLSVENNILEFQDTNWLNSSITASAGGTVRLADNAMLVFGNTAAISVANLMLGTGNAFTFNGTAQVNFASQDLSSATITVSADLLGEPTVIATGVTLAADQGISVGDNTYTLGETFIYGDKEYAFNCTGSTFSVADVTKYDEVFVAPDGTQSIVIDGQTIPLAGKPVYTSLDSALDHMAANGSVTVYNTTDSVLSTYAYFMSTQTVNGDLNIVADGLDFTRYYVIGNAASTEVYGNVSGDIYFEFRNAETERIMLSGENKAHDLCRNGVITVKDANVTGYISGGGSGANCRIAGDITINVTDSTVAAVYATRGNPVGGEAVINLSGSTVGTVAKTDGAAVTVPVTLNVIGSSASEITGNASGLDAITVNSGATLQLGAGAQVNNTVVKAGGALEIASGANTGAKLTLDFNGAASGAATGVNDLGLVGASTTVYVEGLEQSYGTFTLGYGATGNEAFALGFGDGNDYTMNGELTSVVDAFTGKTYSTSVDAGALKITAAAGTHTIAAVAAADSLAVSGATFNGSDREAKWTADTTAAGNVYLTSGMTDGNAWLELDGYDGGTGTTLYGTAANQTFDGAVNVDLKSGSLRNLAAGAGTGGSVKAVNLTFDGATLNGTGYAGGFGSVTGTTDTQIADGTFTKDFYAGALANKLTTVTSVGDVSMTIDGGTFSGNIYGASAVKTDTTKGNGTRHTVGDVTLNISGGETTKGTQACIFAGGYATGDATGTVYTVNSVTANISGGSWGTAAGGRGIFGGIMVSGVTAEVLGDVSLTISGDATMGNVYGGGWAQKAGAKSIVGNVNISIVGGTIANVFGGGSYSTSGGTTETGDVTITVSGGNITGDIFARGQLDGDTTGNAAVIFTGAADFGCGVFGYSYVGGAASDATLSYTGYTGEFAGAIGGFDGITFDGATAMTLATAAANVSNGAWEFDLTDRTSALAGTSLLTWSTADFENDTIKVSFADDAQAQGGWNIATVANAFSGTTFDVKIGDSEIASDLAYGQQIAAGDYAGFGFELESGVLKFKNIA